MITESIYPTIHADIITIYNEHLKRTIQILKLEGNTDRPYMFKQTIIKGSEFIEGSKYYRELDSSTRIPPTDEDRLFRKWKHEDLQPPPPKIETSEGSGKEPFIIRLINGNQLLTILLNSDAYDFAHDELKNDKEVELVGDFLQNMQDYGDLLSDIEMGERVKLTYEFSKYSQQLEDKGFWVFGRQNRGKIRMNNEFVDIIVAILRVYRDTNPEIILIPEQNTVFSEN